ncbi:MAG: S-layer homology domain-containing protein [bacterium]
MGTPFKRLSSGCILFLLGVSLFACFMILLVPQTASASAGNLEITGPGLKGEGIIITQDQLRGNEPLTLPDGRVVEQYDEWYSSINTWPSKIWYRGQGIRLRDLLDAAGGLNEDATQVRFISSDGFRVTFTLHELLKEPSFRFPNFMDTGLPGHIPGDPSGAVPVEPMIAHRSFSAHTKEEIMNDRNFDSTNGNHLLFGQRAVTQQNNARFAKYIIRVEVLTDEILKWDKPKAVPPPGEVSVGTLVELYSPLGDEDKVYYTLDGSDPTIKSPMYNWVASRWWSSRGTENLAAINRPIEITEDTIIKAVTIGPGKADSDVAVFRYKVIDGKKSTVEPFTDIQGHWAQHSIIQLFKLGAISGNPDGTFKPDHKITRAEYVTMLVKTFQMEKRAGRVFADTASHWARDYIATAVASGIASGYDDNTFAPNDALTREQMAVMLVKAAQLAPLSDSRPEFTDSGSISAWAVDAMVAAVQNGILSGYPDNTIRPKGNATRAEAVTVVLNALR